MICSLCHLEFPDDEGAWCRSCEEWFCDDDFDLHFQAGPHIVYQQNGPTEWYRGTGPTWPRNLIGEYSYGNDGTGRDIWIPGIEPDQWFTADGRRI